MFIEQRFILFIVTLRHKIFVTDIVVIFSFLYLFFHILIVTFRTDHRYVGIVNHLSRSDRYVFVNKM